MGDKIQEAAVRAGYGPTIRADAVKKLVDSVVGFQERSLQIVEEMREMSTQELGRDPRRRRGRQARDGEADRRKARRSRING